MTNKILTICIRYVYNGDAEKSVCLTAPIGHYRRQKLLFEDLTVMWGLLRCEIISTILISLNISKSHGIVLAPLTTLSLLHRRKKAPRGKPLEALILLHLSIIRY